MENNIPAGAASSGGQFQAQASDRTTLQSDSSPFLTQQYHGHIPVQEYHSQPLHDGSAEYAYVQGAGNWDRMPQQEYQYRQGNYYGQENHHEQQYQDVQGSPHRQEYRQGQEQGQVLPMPRPPSEKQKPSKRWPRFRRIKRTQRPQRPQRVERGRHLWAWEIAASALGFACMASIIGVLWYEQGKPLDQWGLGQRISPTALVAFLGTIGKSACLLVLTEVISQLKWIHFGEKPQKLDDLEKFDAASRGPWGAFILAVSKHKTTLLATGASLVVLAFLLVDPFLQLVFEFPIIYTATQGPPPAILTSQVYDPFSLPIRAVARSYGPAQVAPAMQAAILSPIWSSTRSPALPCFYDRCEWPTITTLGVCSECVDLTSTVQPTCRLGKSNAHIIDCNYTIPSPRATLPAVFGMTGGASDMVSYHTLWNSVTTAAWNTPVLAGSDHVGTFVFIKIAPDLAWPSYIADMNHANISLKGNPPVAQAMHCTLDLCARTFTNPYYGNFSASPLDGPQTPLVMVETPNVNNASGMFAELVVPANSSHVPMNTTFKINYSDYNDLAQYMNDLFSIGYDSAGVAVQNLATQESVMTPNVGLFLSQSDMPELMKNISDSMTEAFRTSPNSTQVEGVGKSARTYISIRWGYLALPIVLVIFSLALLIVVIIRTQARKVSAWKSSSLAILFHELDGWDRPEKEVLGPQDLKECADKMRVRAINENGVLQFSMD